MQHKEARVVHCKKEPYDVYIGRPSKWGNPFTHKSDRKTLAKYVVATKEEAVDAYRDWLVSGDGQHLLEDIHELEGKTLSCWCGPDKACHGNVLIELLAEISCE
jgi:hypothetical protein